jgi:hypothetical protein
VKFGNFLGNFGGFFECLELLGHNCSYFLETEGPTAIPCNVQRPRQNLKEEQGVRAKFVGYNGSGIVFQWKNPWTGWRGRVHAGPIGDVDHGHAGPRRWEPETRRVTR